MDYAFSGGQGLPPEAQYYEAEKITNQSVADGKALFFMLEYST